MVVHKVAFIHKLSPFKTPGIVDDDIGFTYTVPTSNLQLTHEFGKRPVKATIKR
jgi:hypothetical protein